MTERKPPQGMPPEPPAPDASALRGKQKPADLLPRQRPVTDEDVPARKPSRVKRFALKVVYAALLVVALAGCYVFLLLGEPGEDAKYLVEAEQQAITMPMTAVETPGEANVSTLAETFGESVLSLYGSELTMQRARVYDTAFAGGYARRVTLSYAFSDGAVLTVESIRPASAVTLLSSQGYALDPTSLYALGGLDAAMMDNGSQLCVFSQNEQAAYAVICPASHAGELSTLLGRTTLTTSP